MKKGDIVFMQGKGVVSKLIRFFDRGKYSHCALALSDNRVIEANYDTRVNIRTIDKDRYGIIDVIDLGLSDESRDKVCNKALLHLGVKYDYLQLVWYVLQRVFRLKGRNLLNNPNNMICSEFVYIVLDESGVLDDLNIRESFHRGSDLTPNQLYDLVKFATTKERGEKVSTR